MKKLYYLVVLMLLTGTSLQAKQIDVNKAKSIAESFFQQQSLTRADGDGLRLAYTATDDASATRSASSANLFYVFDRGESNGFIVVAGDDRMRPVLGYTNNGSFDINTQNDGLQWWLTAITEKAKAVADGKDTSTFSSTRSSSSSVEPIVKTQWNQYSPYNDQCPVDNTDGNGGRSLTGCVATAMAQILYTCYAGTTQTLSGTVACRPEAHASSTTDVDLSQFTIDYGKMELSYDGDESDEAKAAVATLMYACGLSVNMNYCANSSGSNASSYTFIKYFGIDGNCSVAHRTQYTSDEWDNLLHGELDNGRAVLYSGLDYNYAGHAFICDGYNSEGLYHINWGWGGYNDGYFDLYSIDFKYVNLQDAVCGIKPGVSDVDITDLLSYVSLTAKDTTLPIENATSLSYAVTNLYCYGGDFNGYLGLAICNSDGTIVKTLRVLERSYVNNCYYSFSEGVSLPTDLADGIYELRIAAGTTADNLKVIKGEGSYASLTLSVSNGSITISGYQPEAAQLSIESYTVGDDGCGYVGIATPVTLNIKNNGGEFLGDICVDSKTVTKAAVKPGETKQVTINVTPTAEGSQTFTISAIDDYDNSATKADLGSVTIDVKAASEATPNLVVESVEFAETDLTLGDKATLIVKVRNDGGQFKGNIYAKYGGTFRYNGSNWWYSGVYSDIPSVEIFRDKSATISLDVSYFDLQEEMEYGEFTISSLEGSYTLNNEWNPVTLATYEGDAAPSFKARQTQTITWNQSFDDVHADSEVELQATASSGLAVEYQITSGSEYAEITDGKLIGKAVGTVVVEASQTGSEKYKAAEAVNKTIVILEASSIVGVSTANGVNVDVSGNSLIVKGAAGATIRIYSVGGALLKSFKAEETSIQIDGLTSGQSYIVSVNGKRVKILL